MATLLAQRHRQLLLRKVPQSHDTVSAAKPLQDCADSSIPSEDDCENIVPTEFDVPADLNEAEETQSDDEDTTLDNDDGEVDAAGFILSDIIAETETDETDDDLTGNLTTDALTQAVRILWDQPVSE